MTNLEKKLLLESLMNLRSASLEAESVLDELGGDAFAAFHRLRRSNELAGKKIDALQKMLLP